MEVECGGGFAESRTEGYTRTVGCGGGGWMEVECGGVLQNHAQKGIHARWDVGVGGGGGVWSESVTRVM